MIDEHPDGFSWRLIRAAGASADVVARGARVYPDECSCRRAAADLVAATGEAMLVVQAPDGHWRWQVCGPDGTPLAESPSVYRDAASCGRALHELRRDIVAFLVAR
jgi:hypothetical protein